MNMDASPFGKPPLAKDSDDTVCIGQLKELVNQFVAERGWEKYHSPKNLAMSIAIESAELMEHFQWSDPPAPIEPLGNDSLVAQEISDILAYTLRIACILGIDLSQAFALKMVRNRAKYPIGMAYVPKGLPSDGNSDDLASP
jgi:dCTP diphosphatase